jgi:hypothetical protein
MKTWEIVNLIVKKFGGNRVAFFDMTDFETTSVSFILGGNRYVAFAQDSGGLLVYRYPANDAKKPIDSYSKWVEGVLNNLVRNEAGEMVPR